MNEKTLSYLDDVSADIETMDKVLNLYIDTGDDTNGIAIASAVKIMLQSMSDTVSKAYTAITHPEV